MAKKEKEKVFTEMQFNDAQYAQDVLANSQSKLERCKIALIVALVVQVLWVLAFFAPNAFSKMPWDFGEYYLNGHVCRNDCCIYYRRRH